MFLFDITDFTTHNSTISLMAEESDDKKSVNDPRYIIRNYASFLAVKRWSLNLLSVCLLMNRTAGYLIMYEFLAPFTHADLIQQYWFQQTSFKLKKFFMTPVWAISVLSVFKNSMTSFSFLSARHLYPIWIIFFMAPFTAPERMY